MTGIERLRGVAGFWRENRLDDIVEQIERETEEWNDALEDENERLRDMLNQVAWHLGLEESVHYYSDDNYQSCQKAVLAAIDSRLMPEGCEWPRYESGELVNLGDRYECWCGKTHVVSSVSVRKGCSVINASDKAHKFIVSDGPLTSHGKRVKRPAPKVYDADGVEIREGDRVWSTHLDEPHEWIVIDPHEDRGDSQTVLVSIGDRTGHARPENLTHRAPVLAADGEPLKVGQTVWDKDAEADTPLTVVEVSSDLVRCEYTWKDGKTYRPCCPPDQLTHQRPDTWQRIEEDKYLNPFDYCKKVGHKLWTFDNAEEFKASDLVRRCRALTERERGE